MATYPACAAALLTLCRAAGLDFDENNSAADDYTVLDAGMDTALLIRMGAPSIEANRIDIYQAHGARQEQHTIYIEVWKALGTGDGGMGAIYGELIVTTEALKDYLRQYERLNATAGVRRAQIVSTTEPRLNGTKTHLVQVITVQVNAQNETLPLEVGG